MNNDKTKILLVCEDGQPSLNAVAGTMQSAINGSHEVKLRLASEVSIQEVLAADCYLFGVGKADSAAWTELRRLFRGINLAGRQAAFFAGDIRESALLRDAFKDAGLVVSDPDLLVKKGADASVWVRGALAGT
ncbi:MAG: hypothetical protein A3J97_09770 [Spirochaetes bacterium RIFOXYC1_FULL_54_7]|nr:MAG: hypothetical protein A3J97_09770 [Spirochaetes bacterium RIFOXYC1_FULL_54_7]